MKSEKYKKIQTFQFLYFCINTVFFCIKSDLSECFFFFFKKNNLKNNFYKLNIEDIPEPTSRHHPNIEDIPA